MKALLDANVLYPAPLRDLWMRLSVAGAFEPRWTDQIHDEWTRNVRRDRPDLPPQQLERTRRLMDAHALEAKVAGYEGRIAALELPDPDDRHVLAAALHAGAPVIVTFNLKDFPSRVLGPLGVVAQHPDAFALERFAHDPDKVLETLREQRGALKNPPITAPELLKTLSRQDLERTVNVLMRVLDRI